MDKQATKAMLTSTQVAELQSNVEAYAIEQGWTKQQTIAFSILALFDRGYGIARSVEMVCGAEAIESLAGIDWTAHDLLAAVQKSFFI